MTDGGTIPFLDAVFVKPDESICPSSPLWLAQDPRDSTVLTGHEETQHVQSDGLELSFRLELHENRQAWLRMEPITAVSLRWSYHIRRFISCVVTQRPD